MNTIKKEGKEYVIIYRSEEHYEVLGYVSAPSIEEAKKRAQVKLIPEAKYYTVSEAEIVEISNIDKINFNIEN
jgi:hypothetical protein